MEPLDSAYDLLALPKNRRICIYGTGRFADNFFQLLRKVREDIVPICFIDDTPQPVSDNLPVYTLYDLLNLGVQFDTIIAAVPEKDWPETASKLQSYGLKAFQFAGTYLLLGDPLLSVDWESAPFDVRCLLYGRHETILIKELEHLPAIDVAFSRISTGIGDPGSVFDIVDFHHKNIGRWWIPKAPALQALETSVNSLPERYHPTDPTDDDFLYSRNLMGHTAHVGPQGHILSANVFYNYFMDTSKQTVSVFPENYMDPVMIYSDSGCFSSDYAYWYFVRWPIREAVEVKSGSRETVKCQVGRFNLQNQQIELLYEVDYLDNVHQINIFSDRYLVFTSFKQRLNVPYPETSINDDPDGYRASHAAGLKLTDMVTVDLKTRSHWFTTIPVPVPAHFEEDPVEENVFYVSAHNLVNHRGEVLLEGPAALFKIRIDDHNNVIAGAYSEENLYRATSHRAFRYRHKTLLAVTNVPNRLDLIDADKMELWRRIELRKATSYNFTKTGNALCNLDPGMYLSLVTSKDGRYVILESLEDLAIYDTEKNALLPARIHSYPAEGYIRYGHCVEVKN